MHPVSAFQLESIISIRLSVCFQYEQRARLCPVWAPCQHFFLQRECSEEWKVFAPTVLYRALQLCSSCKLWSLSLNLLSPGNPFSSSRSRIFITEGTPHSSLSHLAPSPPTSMVCFQVAFYGTQPVCFLKVVVAFKNKINPITSVIGNIFFYSDDKNSP